MFEQLHQTCMHIAHMTLAFLGHFCQLDSENFNKILTNLNYYIGQQLYKMSTVCHGAYLAIKIRQNEKKPMEEQEHHFERNVNTELNPMQYNSKMMNAIWGLYNRYSVHNLKKNIDKNLPFPAMNQQMQSVGSTEGGKSLTTSRLSLLDNLWACFGNPY